MEFTKADKVQYLEPQQFTAADKSVQGFTTRHGGVSRPPYNSLNLGTNTQDSHHSVMGNRSLLTRSVGARIEKMVTVNQVHGSDLLIIDAPNHDFSHFLKIECDGIVTDQPGVLIGICVADCFPLLLLDPVKGVAAALHAGWKGTAAGIATKGVAAFVECFGSKPGDILAAIGPGIGPCCYEVDTPVKDAFIKGKEEWDAISAPRAAGKWDLNLQKANFRQLVRAGVTEQHIDMAEQCVACNHDLFFSHRRDHGETGRQLGFIMLKG